MLSNKEEWADNERESDSVYNDDEFEDVSLFSFIIGFFIFLFRRFMKP